MCNGLHPGGLIPAKINMENAARATLRIGTAGWSISGEHRAIFGDGGSQLERYASRFNACEINSSFHRPHKLTTYQRWANSVPEHFLFAVKVPKAITHERRLREADDLLDRFLAEIQGLGAKLGPLLLQLPLSLAFESGVANVFLGQLRARTGGAIVCEPRHASWFAPEVEAVLLELHIGRVAADPARLEGAEQPGGWRGLAYRRLHGSPRVYYSRYDEDTLDGVAQQLKTELATGIESWCIFDNTASGAATGDALAVVAKLEKLAHGGLGPGLG